jgi:hypothetical protein
MNKVYLLLIITSTLWQTLNAQERYVDEVFTDAQISVTENVKYSRNFSILPALFGQAPAPTDLVMDIYAPDATIDTETNRPVTMVLHGGSFLPAYINNNCWGYKEDVLTVLTARKLARLGYVVAVPSFRLGWNPLATTPNEFLSQLSDATIRIMIDIRTAARYLRKDVAENGNTYSIDPSKIIAWGLMDGTSTVVANLPYLNTVEDFQTPNYFVEDTMGNIVNIFDPTFFGDLTGETDVILPSGDTIAFANHVGYDSQVSIAVTGTPQYLDTFAIDLGESPLITIRNSFNFTAAQGSLNLSTGDYCCITFSGISMARIADNIGLNDEWKGVEFTNPIANLSASNYLSPSMEPLEGFFTVGAPGDTLTGFPWNTWDDATCQAGDAAYGTGAFPNSIGDNPNHSLAKAALMLDSIVAYVAPRACITLGLGCEGITTATESILENVDLDISPNPSNGAFNFTSPSDQPMKEITVFNLAGSQVARFNVHDHFYQADMNNLSNGLYVARIQFKEGIATQKIVVQR